MGAVKGGDGAGNVWGAEGGGRGGGGGGVGAERVQGEGRRSAGGGSAAEGGACMDAPRHG